ncbi:putative MFS family arabinose efflux permease [Williamsia muralis]|uniref:Putative MFS family arabinose efflux permease n=1 Tax=Williamsia marianensis TaxID=85044 RepID=A0A495JYS5_WILMA|nr:MFS transporter [Williamsia muralis]RKR93655.1 putative MFS family arabinose efflux permease [Williamsia muralis]
MRTTPGPPTDPSSTIPASPGDRPGISRSLVVLFAITCGVSVSSLYVLQPVLEEIRQDFDVSTSTAALVVTAAQLGYAAGLLFLVPLGDLLNRKLLAPSMMVASAVALLLSGLAPGFGTLFVASILAGVCAATAQIVLPWSSSLAVPSDRGRVVGMVMSGLLLGILLARVVSGLIAEFGGWRSVLFTGSALMVVLAVVVYVSVPPDAPRPRQPYGQLLISVARIVRAETMLRQRMLLGFLTMFGFSAMWTSIAFLLSGSRGEHFSYSEAAIGLFGLAGVAGAAAAPLFGKLADRGHLRMASTAAWVVTIIGWLSLAWPGTPLAALVIGLVVFDFGVQASQLANQSAIYSLASEERSRVTTAYMVTYFAGAVAGSVSSGYAYGAGGWIAVCLSGIGVAVAGLLAWLVFDRWNERRAGQSVR